VLSSALTILQSLSYYGSALDFVVIMRLSGLVWNGLLGYLFLGERISRIGLGSVILIVVGILVIFSNFQWSVELFTSKIQIMIQLFSILLMSVGSFFTKKILSIIGRTRTEFSIFDYLAWAALLSLPSTFVISVWKESTSWKAFSAIVTSRMLGLTVFGTLLHQFCHFMVAQMHKLASLMSLGVLAQVKLLGTLSISHWLYGETKWDRSNFTGLGLLVLGGLVYSITRIEDDHKGVARIPSLGNVEEDEVRLVRRRCSECEDE
jgi:drug/metabolite transporter (DMT)-like permease